MNRTHRQRLVRTLIVITVAIGLFTLFYFVIPLIYPFLLAWLLAYLMNPLVRFLQKKARLPRWLAVTLTLLLFLGSIIAVVTALITKVVTEIMALSQSMDGIIRFWQERYEQFIQSAEVQGVINWISTIYDENPDYQQTINTRLNESADTVAQISSDVLATFFNGIISFIAALPSFATILIVILLGAFFISKDWSRHKERFSSLLPEGIRKTTGIVWKDLIQALFGYLQAQFIMISITAVVVIIGLFVLGVNYAITIGLLIGLVDLLPYLGVGAVMVPWIVYQFIYGDLYLAIGLTILYAVIFIVRSLIEPKVLASSIGLDALYTLIAMFVGLKLFGVLGLIIGPVSLVILITLNRANVFKDIKRYIKGSPSAP
ncbi:sporulation integral membrane protein YtvI [Paenibacillus abyssi]|uniref:Sporulation integral membrane protein YtvI n=1 Tax=Paenibacillus abyssi TaxID=1340531 RepID=A0A917D7B4_9BACL|nr:sporulation integral membrane protein YtvI [Paenibacillus abyssi]GGG13330.1 sporulation integral membrane protein YtvI [Paenibacillus abyssi]